MGIAPLATAAERIIEGSPVIVVILSAIGLVVWRTWRQEREQMLTELKEERAARHRAHEQMIEVARQGNEAIHAVRDAVMELRHALKSSV